MNTTQTQQKALDDALVAPTDSLEFEKCIMRLKTDIKPKKATFQLVLDALALTSFYRAFQITADVLAIYIQILGYSFRQEFEDLPLEQDIQSFISDLGHTRAISYLTDVNVDYLHQPWRALATVINKFLKLEWTRFVCLVLKFPRKPVQATKGIRIKTKAKVDKSDKKKKPAKKPKAKGLAVLSEVALTKAGYQKKKERLLHITCKWLRLHDVHIYDSNNDKESWGDSDEEDDDENEFDEEANINDDDSDDNDESGDERTKSDSDELYKDVNVNLENKDADMTYADQGAIEQQNASHLSGFEKEKEDAHVTLTPVLDTHKTGGPTQSSSVYSDFTSMLLNLDNPSPTDNEIASLMDTTAYHATAIPEITLSFKIPTPPPPPFFNPLQKEATPPPSEATTLFTSLSDFTSYAQALSFIPAIVDRYMDNKLGEAINKAIQAHNFDCREEAQTEKIEYIKLVDSTARTIFKEEVNAQLPQILPQVISDVVTPVIKKNVTDSLETVVLTRSSSQPQSSYEAAATLSEFELTKILIDKIKKNKSCDVVDYKRELYDALVKSYNTDKDIFESYGETWISQVAHVEGPPTSFDEFNDTSFDFSAFVMNRLIISNLIQEILVGVAFNLLKGTCKSITELEYHLEECSKATTERLDRHNPKNKPYSFNLRKPLSLIQDHRGR
nr:hypothetical protein [Tanacetum cinerariifolium]